MGVKRQQKNYHRPRGDNPRGEPVTPERCATIAGVMMRRAEVYELHGYPKLAEECRAFARAALAKLEEFCGGEVRRHDYDAPERGRKRTGARG